MNICDGAQYKYKRIRISIVLFIEMYALFVPARTQLISRHRYMTNGCMLYPFQTEGCFFRINPMPIAITSLNQSSHICLHSILSVAFEFEFFLLNSV